MQAAQTGYTHKDGYAVDNHTGEILRTTNMRIIEGSHVFTPQEWGNRKRLAEERKERERRKASNRPLGNFLLVSGQGFEDLPPATLTRLIMLATYADYGQKLMYSRDRPMRRAEAQTILNLSDTVFKQFIREVQPRYLTEKQGVLHLTDKSSFLRGKIPNGDHEQRWKMYIQAIRHIYAVTPIKKHKFLGYAFQLIRHVNLEFNILSHDIYETCLDDVEPMTLYEFCEAIGYDWNHVNRLLSAYRQLVFKVGDHMERFISFAYDGLDKRNAHVFVNPHILYSGSNYHQVEILGAFCKI